MRAELIFETEIIPIPEGDLVRVGNTAECQLRIVGDPFVSRRHCSVSLVNGKLTIVDLNSSHGTIVNGRAISSSPITLNDGDILQIGNTPITVRLK